MGAIIQKIPYKSQQDEDASEFRNDCGPACIAMVLNAFGKNVTTNAVYHKTGASANGYVSVSQLIRAALAYSITFEYFYPWTLNQLKQSISEGKTAIPLVHYGAFSSTGKTQSDFTGPHFVVVVGFDNKHIIVNDPLWWDPRRDEGKHIRWTFAEFEAAWSTAHKDKNRDYSGIYCTHPLPVQPLGPYTPPPVEPPVEPPPPFSVDPILQRRILAWASFNDIPIPTLNSQAVVTAYSTAMGAWGLRVEIHKVSPTDTLPLIALKYYNDPLKWEALVYFNGMTFTDPIHDGDMLLIPEPLQEPVEIPPGEIPSGGTTPYEKSMTENRHIPHFPD